MAHKRPQNPLVRAAKRKAGDSLALMDMVAEKFGRKSREFAFMEKEFLKADIEKLQSRKKALNAVKERAKEHAKRWKLIKGAWEAINKTDKQITFVENLLKKTIARETALIEEERKTGRMKAKSWEIRQKYRNAKKEYETSMEKIAIARRLLPSVSKESIEAETAHLRKQINYLETKVKWLDGIQDTITALPIERKMHKMRSRHTVADELMNAEIDLRNNRQALAMLAPERKAGK